MFTDLAENYIHNMFDFYDMLHFELYVYSSRLTSRTRLESLKRVCLLHDMELMVPDGSNNDSITRL